MKLLRTIVGLVLLALWLPATSLCLLERTGWLSVDGCSPASEAQSQQGCEPSGMAICCSLASAIYKADDYHALTVAVPIAALLDDWDLPALLQYSDRPLPSISTSPPELPKSWQFNYRTALPPRAPSFVS